MFLDASVIVAVLKGEPDGPALLKAMEAGRGKLRYSPVSRLEAVLSLASSRKAQRGDTHATAEDFEVAGELVADLLAAIEAKEMVISSAMGTMAIEALSRYGKVVGHPAKLNMGDALAYACAKGYPQPLLFKGNDFAQTDLA